MNVAVGTETNVEYLLAGLEFPKDIRLLDDPTIWIADSAATVHMTANESAVKTISGRNNGLTITMGNGASEK